MSRIGEKLQLILNVIQSDYATTENEKRRKLILEATKVADIRLRSKEILGAATKAGIHADNLGSIEISMNPGLMINDDNPTWKALLLTRSEMLNIADRVYDTIQSGGRLFFQKTHGIYWNANGTFTDFAQSWHNTGTIRLEYGPMQSKPGKEESIQIRPESMHFIEALVGIPCDHFKKCPDCGNYFVQQTLRERKYCSTKCRNRFNLRKNNN